jgi:hypothetical protein
MDYNSICFLISFTGHHRRSPDLLFGKLKFLFGIDTDDIGVRKLYRRNFFVFNSHYVGEFRVSSSLLRINVHCFSSIYWYPDKLSLLGAYRFQINGNQNILDVFRIGFPTFWEMVLISAVSLGQAVYTM